MPAIRHISTDVKRLLAQTEKHLGIEISVLQSVEAPPDGLLIDSFSFDTDRNVIIIPPTRIGLLKDLLIALHCISLSIRGAATGRGGYRVLSYDEESAFRGVRQIYLDMLKDETTRGMRLDRKRKINFYLYMLLHETLEELPWKILSHAYITRYYPVLHAAQVYGMMKESMQDMHALVPMKNYFPARYFVLHNGMYYARDLLFSEITREYRLNPVLMIPELQRFKNLEVKELLTRRWSSSSWYQSKVVGDTLFRILQEAMPSELAFGEDPEGWSAMYRSGAYITDQWIARMRLQEWFLWEAPAQHRKILTEQETLRKKIDLRLFGP
jgi:hypothetical protein